MYKYIKYKNDKYAFDDFMILLNIIILRYMHNSKTI